MMVVACQATNGRQIVMVDAVSVPGETNPQLPYFGLCTRMRRDANESRRGQKKRKDTHKRSQTKLHIGTSGYGLLLVSVSRAHNGNITIR